MIERAYVQIDGPPKSGKTTFVELVLKACKNEVLLATRFLPGKKPKQAGPAKGNEETKRYQKAGAIGVMAFNIPANAGPEDFESFWSSELIENYSRGILVEGLVVEEIVVPDLVVFVMRPLPDGQPLLERKAREIPRVAPGFADAMEALVARELKALGASLAPALRAKLDAELRQIRHESKTPSKRTGWGLADGHMALPHAQVVVVNIHDESERPAAERLAVEVLRIREDPEVKKDVLGTRGNRRQPAILVANLADPKDKELKKALTRVKKVIATSSAH